VGGGSGDDVRPYLKNTKWNRAGDVAQVGDPKFNPQYKSIRERKKEGGKEGIKEGREERKKRKLQRKGTERSYDPFSQFPNTMVTCHTSIAHYPNQEIYTV
jgi:hypothetical protein